MYRKNLVIVCILLSTVLFFSPFTFAVENAVDDSYKIGPGDVLDISVWKNDELSKVVPVLPDGSVSFPLVGKIQAAGKTLSQFQESLSEKLVTYMANPSLFVVVKQTNIPIYVIGKVKRPGMFKLNTHINVLQSLTLAGGLDRFADRSDIIIMRKDAGETKTYTFDYDKVSMGKQLEQNIELQRGDVVVVH